MKNCSSKVHYVPLYAPIALTDGTKIYSDIVNTKNLHSIDFVIMFGHITGDDMVVTVEASTTAAAGAVSALASWKYRLSSAVGTDSMGAVSTSSSTAATGISVTASDDNKTLVISINPSDLTADYPYVRVAIDPGGSASDIDIAMLGVIWPRYESDTQPSHVV